MRFNAAKQLWETAWKIYHDGPKPINELVFGADKETEYPLIKTNGNR